MYRRAKFVGRANLSRRGNAMTPSTTTGKPAYRDIRRRVLHVNHCAIHMLQATHYLRRAGSNVFDVTQTVSGNKRTDSASHGTLLALWYCRKLTSRAGRKIGLCASVLVWSAR